MDSETNLTNYVADAGAEYKMGFDMSVAAAADRLDQIDSFRSPLRTGSRFDRINWIRNEFEVYRRMTQQIIALRESPRWNTSQYFMVNNAVPLARRSVDLLSVISGDQDRFMREDALRVNSLSNVALGLLFVLIPLLIVSSWVVSRRSSKRITRPLATLSAATQDFASGKLTADIPVDGEDEIAELTLSFNRMRAGIQAAEAELLEAKEASEAANRELRQLIAAAEEEVLAETNLARLRSHLQGKLSATEVATAALNTIVETLKAPSGALYILEEDGNLQRYAAHALPMEAESTTSFPTGSGSIGRAARSREMSTFDPGDQSWSVTFGVGQIAPRQVVTCPLLAGDTVAGVVELYLLSEMTESQSQWLTEASGITAGTLRFVQDNRAKQRTHDQMHRQAIESSLLHRAVSIASDADSFEEALRSCLTAVCESLEWPLGHAYVPAKDGRETLDPTGIWYLDDPKSFAAFRQVTERTSFKIGEGLPGRIWKLGTSEWIANVNDDSNFPRAQQIRELEVKGCFGFPIVIQQELVAVLEFFSRDEMLPDEQLLQTIQSVGMQVGQVLERKRSEEVLRQQIEDLQALPEALT